MTSEESEIINAIRYYAKVQEAGAADRAPLSPNSTRDLMARIRREEGRQRAKKSRLLVILVCSTALMLTAGLWFIDNVLYVPMVYVPLDPPEYMTNMHPVETNDWFEVGVGMVSSPELQGFFLDVTPKLSVDWKLQTIRIPLKTGGVLSGVITPKAGAPRVEAREFEIAASGNSNGESITATGEIVAILIKPIDASHFLQAKDIVWLKLNLTLKGNVREERVYRILRSP